jgi:hypothetical protein
MDFEPKISSRPPSKNHEAHNLFRMERISNRKKDGGNKSTTSTKPMATKNESPASVKGSSDNDCKRNPTLNSFGEVSWENKIEPPTEEYWEWCCCAVSGSVFRNQYLLIDIW